MSRDDNGSRAIGGELCRFFGRRIYCALKVGGRWEGGQDVQRGLIADGWRSGFGISTESLKAKFKEKMWLTKPRSRG